MLVREDYKKESEYFGRIIRIGEKDSSVVLRIQEWLCLHKYHTAEWTFEVDMDGIYGKGTKAAVKEFQELYGLPVTGEVDKKTWYVLVLPLTKAFTKLSFEKKDLYRERVVRCMENFVLQHPTELMSNKGPWIRSFMKGHEGKWAAWCCGTVSTALDHAADSMNKSMTDWLKWTWGCDSLMNESKLGSKTKYYSASEIKSNPAIVERGDIFLVMRSSSDATHTGIVYKVDDDVMYTIEANTNDEGSREGYEMCKRVRSLTKGKYSIIKLL